MSEITEKDYISWLHGLEEYLNFIEDAESAEYVRNFLSLIYADDSFFPLKRLINQSYDRSKNKEAFVKCNNFFIDCFERLCTVNEGPIDLVEWSKIAKIMFPQQELFTILNKFFREYTDYSYSMTDVLSRGQIRSKIWMVKELAKIKKEFDVIYHLGGWYGQITWFLNEIKYKKLRIFDMDSEACKISDTVINSRLIENFRVKSVEMELPNKDSSIENQDMTWVTRTGFEYFVQNYGSGTMFKEKTMPDLIINTSAEHMSSIWFDKLINRPQTSDPIIAIQSNNLFHVPEHDNCVHSIDHMKRKFPMKEILFEGELQLKGYKRFMLIGRS